MKEINTNTYSKITFSILTMLYPITYILGNLAININTEKSLLKAKNETFKLFDIKNKNNNSIISFFYLFNYYFGDKLLLLLHSYKYI